MKKIKCLAVFVILVVVAVFSSCGAKAMSIDEAVKAINKLKSGGSITIVLNNDTAEITEELRRALADESYFDKSSDDFDDYDDWYEYLKQNSKKVSLDLSKTKITEIAEFAFMDCVSLASVTMPDSVTSIGNRAFISCKSLTSVTIPAGVTGIGNSFGGCDNLSISVANDNKYLSAKDGALYNKNGTLLIAWPAAKGDVIIPDSVTSIRHGAFEYCKSLTSVTIPNSVTTIGDCAFNFCTLLTSVNIPDSVTTIGDSAFDSCQSLTSVTIPNSVTTIEDYAFDSCESLHVEIAPHPDGNLRVPENAFERNATVSLRGTTGTWAEIRAYYWN